jgi:aldehyde dehydrogenase (NAD+)
MNAAKAQDVATSEVDVPALYQRLRANARMLRQSSVKERQEKIRKLLKAVLDAREEIRGVVHDELHLCDTDIDAQLIMIKAEAEFIIKQLPQWVEKQPVWAR